MTKDKKKKMDADPVSEEIKLRAAKVYGEASTGSLKTEPEEEREEDMEEITPAEEAIRIEKLENELDETRKKMNDYFEGWQRERADFLNYKKRIERDQVLLSQNITGGVIKKYLVVLDDMERALKSAQAKEECSSVSEGLELIYRKLQNILESEGLTRIQAENEFFNPVRHEALSNEDNPDYESGQIIEVVQQGYMLGDRVLRPALVRVAQ